MESLKAVLESLDGVPDAIKPYYREEGGKHVLSLDNPKEHPSFVKIKGTADDLDKKRRATEQELEALKDKYAGFPDDFDPEIYAKGQNAGDDVDEAVKAAVQRLEKTHARDLEKQTQRADGAESQLHTLLVDNGLTNALTSANVAPPLMEAAKALIKTTSKIEIADGVATIDSDDIGEFVKEWAGSDAGKHFVAAPQDGGGGSANPNGFAGGGGDANPWKKDQFNLSEQGRIIRADPERAERMKREAGAL